VPTSAYNSPGVTVTQTANPSLAPLLANPSVVGLVGPAIGYDSATERLILTGTTGSSLKFTGINPASVVVKALDGTTLSAGNYVVTQGADPNSSITGDEPYTIARFATPATAPTLAAGTGALTGTYHYKVTFVNASGETGPGPASADITVTAQGISLSAIPLGGTGTTARNIYREKSIASVGQGYHLVATVNDNTTTVLANEATSDATAANGASPPVGIASGDTVLVSYNYTDQYYYSATSLSDFNSVVDKYGAPFDANGNISSPLTFAARLIFLNGASEIIAVASKSASEVDMSAALTTLESVPEVRFVSVTTGAANINSDVIAHVNKMNGLGYYRQAVLGVDGSTTTITPGTQRTLAQSINNEAIQMVNSTSFQMDNPITTRPLNVGGQYMAAAITGMWAGRDVQFPLTRKTVAGFVDVNDKRSATDAALDSAAGLLVVQSMAGGSLVVRHSITTAVGDISTREGSVVRAKYEMAHQLQTVLDSSIVGIVVAADTAPLIVQASVIGVLQQLILEGAIQGYDDVTARLLPNDPSTVEVAFSYQPSYPINNISVVFQIDTTTGNLSVVSQ
jgi:hypothetical protein